MCGNAVSLVGKTGAAKYLPTSACEVQTVDVTKLIWLISERPEWTWALCPVVGESDPRVCPPTHMHLDPGFAPIKSQNGIYWTYLARLFICASF